MFQRESAFLLHLTTKLYRQPVIERPAFISLDFDELVRLALRNNVLYYFAKEMTLDHTRISPDVFHLLKRLIELCGEEAEKIRVAIEILEDSFDDYVLIKTCKGFSRIPDDLDVYTPDFDRAFNRLKSKIKLLDYDAQLKEAVFGGNGIGQIHLHSKLMWSDAVFIDKELLSANPNRATFHGSEVNVPSNEAELIINLAHVNYEKFGVDMTDLLHVYRLSGSVDWEIVREQTAKYHWKKTFERTIRLLDEVHRNVYAIPSPFSDLFDGDHNGSATSFELPIPFPRTHVIKSLIERRVVTYILKKALGSILKSTRITLTGKTYQAQGKIPSEFEFYQKARLSS